MNGLKCMMLVPKRYPFIWAVRSGMLENGMEVKMVDYKDFFSKRVNGWVAKYTNLPKKITRKWEKPYETRVNQAYLKIFKEYRPDIVFVYNNQLATPEFFEDIKGKTKIVFLLGDNPLYTRTSLTNLHILYYADYVISPDSMWRDQLSTMGVKNVVLDCFGFAEDVFFPTRVDEKDRKQMGSDFIYFGNAYKTNWGYKRARFLNLFSDYDLKAYIRGNGMERWYPYFPELKKRVLPLEKHQEYNPTFTNLAQNCSKIAPIELVPSFFTGIHVRVFNALGSGILPLCESSKDLFELFEGITIPVIRDYREGEEVARHWLENDEERLSTIARMRERVQSRYAPQKVVSRMNERIFLKVPQHI